MKTAASLGAGQLDRQITIQRKVITQDATYGTEIVTWAALTGRIWAQVQDALPSRSEAVVQGLAVARNQTRIRFRFLSGVDSSMRVLVHWSTGDVVHQIVGGPATIGRNEWTEIMTERISS